MKKKLIRIALVLLSVCMIAGILGGCKTKTDPQETGTTETSDPNRIPTGSCRIIIAGNCSTDVRNAARRLAQVIGLFCGNNISVCDDDITAEDAAFNEILIGKTNRAASGDEKNTPAQSGYLIRRDGGTVVIAGTTASETVDAVEYFLHHVIRERCADGQDSFLLEEGYCYEAKYETFSISGKKFDLVYSKSLDTVDDGPTYAHNGLDYDYDLALQTAEILKKCGATVTLKTDEAAATENEILFGNVNRPECETFLASIDATQYGYGVVNGKFVIGGYGAAAEERSVALLKKALAPESATPKTSLSIGTATVRTEDAWYLGVPSYPGGVLVDAAEEGFDELVYSIRKTSPEQYEEFCASLVTLGMEKTYENTIENNVFRTYTGKTGLIYAYHTPGEKMTRIISGKKANVIYPTNYEENYEKVADVSITQLQLDFSTNSGGMGYVVTLEDGSFLLIDSGSTGTGNLDHVRLWNLLNQLNRRADGKILIRGWIMTHPHADHFQVFREFCKMFGNKVTVEKYYECVVAESERYNSKNPGDSFESLMKVKETVKGGFETVMLHPGMKFTLPGITLETLYTMDDLYYQTLRYFNNSSTCFRITVPDSSADGVYQTLITGDIYSDACDIILKRYTSATLKSDIVQVAHHGNQGATKAFYIAVDPDVALWPTSAKLMQGMLDPSGALSYNVIDRYLYNSLHVKENYNNSDSTVYLKLPYTLGSVQKMTVPTTNQYQ